jgi:hypothetical protein
MMNANLLWCVLALAVLATWPGRCPAQEPPDKWFVVESTVNAEPSFMLRVDVDKPDRVYAVGETMTVRVRSEKDCYLYLLYYSAGDRVGALFPNRYQQNNFIRANQTVSVPGAGAGFQFTARPPCGQEVLQVIGTLEPVDVLQARNLTKGAVTPLSEDILKDMVVELKKTESEDWAEARIQITTVPGEADRPTGPGKRYAVCVGISEYSHDRVPTLKVSHLDAQRMAAALKDQCGVADVTLLCNTQATREAVEKAIFRELPAKTRPGDTVFLFFSGHGGRTADTNGDETDGYDEYLVPHDGVLGQPETMILDDTFARWIRELDGRRVAIILDNCYSGGASKAAKGVGPMPARSGPLDFFDGELARTKDLGQQGTMVIAACEANQIAWEMPSADQGSVLTYNVLKSLAQPTADGNGDGELSLGEVFRFVREPVAEYVRKTFSAEQTPVLLDNANDGILLKP